MPNVKKIKVFKAAYRFKNRSVKGYVVQSNNVELGMIDIIDLIKKDVRKTNESFNEGSLIYTKESIARNGITTTEFEKIKKDWEAKLSELGVSDAKPTE